MEEAVTSTSDGTWRHRRASATSASLTIGIRSTRSFFEFHFSSRRQCVDAGMQRRSHRSRAGLREVIYDSTNPAHH